MKTRDFVFAVIVQGITVGISLPSYAFDLTGAWSTEKSTCDRVFKKNATAIVFNSDSDMWGKGFIVEGNHIRGQSLTCVIKSRKETGTDINLVASCATDIMVDQTQLSFKITGADSIARVFPGMDLLETPFFRCSF